MATKLPKGHPDLDLGANDYGDQTFNLFHPITACKCVSTIDPMDPHPSSRTVSAAPDGVRAEELYKRGAE